jgi:hypothetical protein
MSSLQQFAELQELEYYAAVSDIKNAIERFGIDIIAEALEDIGLTDVQTSDILVVH